ncbi:MAG: class I SAM-dependent methyltransferase [Thermoplasmatales archaeon]
MTKAVTTEDLYKEGEEKFGPFTSFIYGLGSALLNRYYEEIVEDLRSKNFDRLLDVGCGNGVLLSKLAVNFPDAKLYGLDPSPHMLNRARKYVKKKGVSTRVELKEGSSRMIPYEEKFDVIVSSFSYHHWADRDTSLVSLMSHLKDNGLIVIYEYDNSSRKFSSSHGVDESEWNGMEIDGVKKTITRKAGLIILTLSK